MVLATRCWRNSWHVVFSGMPGQSLVRKGGMDDDRGCDGDGNPQRIFQSDLRSGWWRRGDVRGWQLGGRDRPREII